ncbi:DEAD/DEAH box helicase family protein [bacterium]|nr:DEAD/DEAH box helicase family protein [bacterium]
MTLADPNDYIKPEDKARIRIDEMLQRAGWVVQDYKAINLYAGTGVAVRELVTNAGPADYVLFINRQAVGAIEAKKRGTTLAGVEWQTVKYQSNIPDEIPAVLTSAGRLPYGYESTGSETWFTCRFDPEPTARRVFWFHRPETLADEVESHVEGRGGSLRARLATIPALSDQDAVDGKLRDAQTTAIRSLETSLKDNKPRALIQMATGSGKTFAAANIAERLITQGDAKRILFLVDRANLGDQTLKEFQGFDVPGTGRKFGELYNVQRLSSNVIDPVAKVCISTIQRVYSILRGDAMLDPDLDELSGFDHEPQQTVEVDYTERLPIEAFDVIIIDECHRSIYGVWRQVLEYFDAFLIGLTATPGKQTFGFFNQNMVMEYGFPQAVADGVNVDFDVFRLSTAISEHGSTIEGGQGYVTTFRNRETLAERLEQVDEDLSYGASELDKKVVAKDQIRTIVRAFRDNLPVMFPDRERNENGQLTYIPKTLIFAKDDSHAEDIVRIVREEFGRGNDIIAKITYKSSDGNKPKDLIKSFRNSYNPRIAVTVDMIATGTDVRPIEAVLFMRMVRSRGFFEQMKGRGVRTIGLDELQAVTPDAGPKDRFVLIDAVGVTETKLIESTPLERKRGIPLAKLLHQARLGHINEDLVSSLASRLARLDTRIAADDRARIEELAGITLNDLSHQLVEAIDADHQYTAAQQTSGQTEPSAETVAATKLELFEKALYPIASNPALCEELENVQRSFEQVIDEISQDEITRADFVIDAESRAQETIDSFRQFLDDNQDEITALQVYYSKPYAHRPTYTDIKQLADAIAKPPHRWTTDKLWDAYETLDETKVRGSAGTVLTNLVSLIRFTLGLDDNLEPWPQHVAERFDAWMHQQQQTGTTFTEDQTTWLTLIRDHLAASLTIDLAELQDPPFSQHGGIFKARELFGQHLDTILTDLTRTLAA